MSLPYPIAASQTDAKSPLDDNLMDSIRLDLEYLDTVSGGGAVATSGIAFNLNGPLSALGNYKSAIDTSMVVGPFVPSALKYSFKRGGDKGVLDFQLFKKANTASIPIVSVKAKYSGAVQSISRAIATKNIQAIARLQATQNTQSIVYAYTSYSVVSVVKLSDNMVRYNLSASLASTDYKVGDTIVITGLTTAANNGRFVISIINESGYPSVVVMNAAAVTESSSGTINLAAFRYSLPNPVTFTDVARDHTFTFAGHTDAPNNGNFAAYAINVGGNGVIVKNPLGTTQGSITGTVQTNIWQYTCDTFSTADISLNDALAIAGCANTNNNGNKRPINWNGPAGTFTVYNLNGAAQASPQGQFDFFLWNYALDANPVGLVAVGDTVKVTGATATGSNGPFPARSVSSSPSNFVRLYAEDASAQALAAGTMQSLKKFIEFEANQSSIVKVGSFLEIELFIDSKLNRFDTKYPIEVTAINQVGQFNAEVSVDCVLSDYPCGVVTQVFYSVTPVVSYSADKSNGYQRRFTKFNSTTAFTGETINNLDLILLFIKNCSLAGAEGLTVVLR